MSAAADIVSALQSALTTAQALTGYPADKQTLVEGVIADAIAQVQAHLAAVIDQ